MSRYLQQLRSHGARNTVRPKTLLPRYARIRLVTDYFFLSDCSNGNLVSITEHLGT